MQVRLVWRPLEIGFTLEELASILKVRDSGAPLVAKSVRLRRPSLSR